MHTLPVSHFLHFEQLENDQLGKFFDSCAADGAECLSLTPPELERLAAEPLRIRLLQTESARTGIRFLNAHAPYGDGWDLNCPDPVRRNLRFARRRNRHIAYRDQRQRPSG